LRIAALYDVHGNLPALEAVLQEVEHERVDAIVSGGDLFSKPAPGECYELLRGSAAIFVRGNADRGEDAGFADVVAEWPLTAELDADGLGPVLFCHGSPRSDEEILTRISPDERVEAALAGVAQQVVVGGHTHVQFDRVVAGRRLVNAGSVGLAYEGRPGAYWALLGPDVELRRTEYDVEAAARALDAVGTPEALDRAGWLRDPPDPAEVSAYFESTVGA
jgi:putative phosphoesterase